MSYLVPRKQKLSWSLLLVSGPDYLGSGLIIGAGKALIFSLSSAAQQPCDPHSPAQGATLKGTPTRIHFSS